MTAQREVVGNVWLTIYTPTFPFTFRFGTRSALRDGEWFDGAIIRAGSLSEQFSLAAVAAGEKVTVSIAVGSSDSSQLRATLATSNFTFEALLEVDTVKVLGDTTTLQALTSKRFRYVGERITANVIELEMSSVDDAVLDEVYPPDHYTTADYPNLYADAHDRPIPYPVGTALKLPCALLSQQTLWDGALRVPEWLYGVCELKWLSYAITAVNTGAKTFTVAGDRTGVIQVGDSLWVFDPASRTVITNEGKYTVTARSYSAPNTVITVSETISSATVAGAINVPPRVLSVYRNGLKVNPTEYTVEVLDTGAGPVPATVGDFSTGATDWATGPSGTGTATLASGTAAITGDGGATNIGAILLQNGRGTGVQQRRHQYAPWRITVTGTGAAWLCDTTTGSPIAGHGTLVRAGSPVRVLVRRASNTSDLRCRLTTVNAGATGTSLTFDNWSIEQPAVPLLMLRFTREQRDSGGGLYTLEADVLGYDSRNVVDEVQRLIEHAGLDIETASFGLAKTYATDNVMLVDCDHGARGARKLRAILEDLMFVARGVLTRNGLGEYVITQDREVTVPGPTYNEQGDDIEVLALTRSGLIKATEIQYRPGSRDPSQLLHTLRRDVFGASGVGVATRPCPYVRDHEVADRLVCYLQTRALAPRRVRARLYMNRHALGDRVAIVSNRVYPSLPSSTFDGTVSGLEHNRLGVEFELMEIAALDTYTPGTLPADIVEAYEPDYSQTAPAAPTALKITAAIGGTGRVSVEAIPPAENWAELWFVVTHNTNGQIMGLILGDYSATTGKATTTIGGLTTGQVYKLQAYAKNAFLLQGALQSTFDATANGGGAAVTTFTA